MERKEKCILTRAKADREWALPEYISTSRVNTKTPTRREENRVRERERAQEKTNQT